jgi:orotate phosphoribosyltransferase
VDDYKQDFIALCLECRALRFGEFKLKSGRNSPYFFNAGVFNTAASLSRLGDCYAKALQASLLDVDVLFGPAYKGIPIACATALSARRLYGHDYAVSFDRKEAKDHGEGGRLLGAEPRGRVMIVDDVITAGTSVRYSLDLIEAAGAQTAGVLIALDRQERGKSALSAVQEIEQQHDIAVLSIIKLGDLLEFLADAPDQRRQWQALKDYQTKYGVN